MWFILDMTLLTCRFVFPSCFPSLRLTGRCVQSFLLYQHTQNSEVGFYIKMMFCCYSFCHAEEIPEDLSVSELLERANSHLSELHSFRSHCSSVHALTLNIYMYVFFVQLVLTMSLNWSKETSPFPVKLRKTLTLAPAAAANGESTLTERSTFLTTSPTTSVSTTLTTGFRKIPDMFEDMLQLWRQLLSGVFPPASREKSIITRGLESFTSFSCIRFRPSRSSDRDWLQIESQNG